MFNTHICTDCTRTCYRLAYIYQSICTGEKKDEKEQKETEKKCIRTYCTQRCCNICVPFAAHAAVAHIRSHSEYLSNFQSNEEKES